MNQVILSLGSNVGNRAANLRSAVLALGRFLEHVKLSPVYETKPWGGVEQGPFYNLCLAAETSLDPHELLRNIKQIERDLGRSERKKWGPREIDIDIVSYNHETLSDEYLTLPHPHMSERPFVLVPLADIMPDFVHPLTGESIERLLMRIERGDARRLPLHLERLERRGYPLRIEDLATGRGTLVMGILNATPDSFSGDGLLASDDVLARAVSQAVEFVKEGAHLLDIGGESTRPISTPVPADEELRRLLPLLVAIRQTVDVPISVDTYRARVAEAALEAGADMVNDVWALRMDPEMAEVVARHGCPVVLMHNRSAPKDEAQSMRLAGGFGEPSSDDVLSLVKSELQVSIELAHAAGIQDSQIIVDPGIGFGKTLSQNLQLVGELDRLVAMGYPVLIGPSRKSFIGRVLDLPEWERLEGTAAVIALAIDRGAAIVRVHDVKSMVRVVQMTDSIVRSQR